MSNPVDEKTLELHFENLRLWAQNTLATKADLAAVNQRLDAYDRGELPNGMILAIKALVRKMFGDSSSQRWMLRSSKASVGFLALSCISLVLSTLVAAHVIG